MKNDSRSRALCALVALIALALPARAEFTCELTFPHAPATALANFPVLVRISEEELDGFSYTDCPESNCLWFTDANDDPIPCDVDTWDDEGTSLVWVSVPSLSDTAKVTMHWDAAGAPSGQPASSAVWSRADYVGVWHMNELVYDSVKEKHYTPDASASGWNAYKVTQSDAVPAPVTTAAGATAHTTPLTDTAMNISYGAGKNNTSYGGFAVPMAQTSSFTLGGSGFTLSAIVNSQQIANNGRGRVIAFGDSYTDKANLTVGSDTIYVMGSNYHNKNHTKGTTDWIYTTGVFNSPRSKIYADGVCLSGGNEGNPSLASLALTKGIGLGCFIDGKNVLDGYLDEARIRNVASTAEWIAAEYATVTDASYVSFGEVEGGGGAAALEFRAVAVSDVTATNATLATRLKGIGDGATAADVRVFVSGFGRTRSYPVTNGVEGAASIVATLEGLNPGTEWTAWFAATNNASPAAWTNSATVAFSTVSDGISSAGGLVQAVTSNRNLPKNAAAGWDIAGDATAKTITGGPLAMRSSGSAGDVWFASDGTDFHWTANTGYGYTGYMYMEGGKDYWFSGAIDDEGYVWVDNGAANWDANFTGSQLGNYGNWKAKGPFSISETGWYRVVFSVWNSSGDAGAEQANNPSLFPKLRYAAVEPGAGAPASTSSDWLDAVDPGDGSLFMTERSTGGVFVLSAARDGTVLSARIALVEAPAGVTRDLRYVYGATHGGDDPANWTGGGLVASSLGAAAATNDYVVGIASDTRYVRFYTQSGESVDWSATVSIEWVPETAFPTTFLFTGEVSASGVTMTNATISGRLAGLGSGATSADVWLVVSGFGRTNAYAVMNLAEGAAVAAALSGLNPGVEWTAHFTATNNLGAGADSAAVSFSTPSDAGFTGTPGLYQSLATSQSTSAFAADAAHGWNIAADGVVTPGPEAMRHTSETWTSADGTPFAWAANVSFGYAGYMYLVAGKDYYFSGAIDDAGYVWVDDGSADWYAVRTSSQFGTAWKTAGPYRVSETGFHPVVFSAWNNTGNGGATGNNALRYVAVEPGASAPAQASAEWLTAVDPGDGSLFLPTPPVRAVTVLSARRDGTVLSARLALAAPVEGETSELRYAYGATYGGDDLAGWTGGGLIASSLPAAAATNDVLVGIASDTRYVRFYTQSGESVNWSATVSIDWAGETTLADTFLFTGELSASGVTTTNATIAGHLAGLGSGATSADVWLILSGFGQTKTYVVTNLTEGAAVAAALSGLLPGVEWTAHFTATNNLGAGADSAPFTFSTLSEAGATGAPGFYQAKATTQATLQSAATWDIVGDSDGTMTLAAPLGLRAAVGIPWYSTDGTSWTYGGNTGYGYSGYMFMEGGKDYWFSAGIDDAGYMWVDNGAENWDATRTSSQFPTGWAASGPYAVAADGWYHVVFAGWNGGGNGGASGSYGALRYVAVASGESAPLKESTTWIDAVDPGDGSLFRPDRPLRTVTVLSADRDGDLVSAKVALGAAFAGEASVLRYVYGATAAGDDPADWDGGSLVSASLPSGAVTNDWLVGIAADTRFVRFYATDGISFTWSDTVALDWAGETEIADTFLFLGDPDAAGVTADAATLSAVLNAPGGGASSAEAWFVVAGGGETFVLPAGTANGRANLSVPATGLTPETAYTFYATATNDAAAPVGVDSATGSFTTGPAASAWNTGKTTWTFDGKSITATVPVMSLGIGTTVVQLKTGSNWNVENTVSASATVTEPGVVTLTADFSDQPWGTKIYYSLALVNGTAEYAITNWPNVNVAGSNIFYNKFCELQDNSTYTWIGGATGVWNDTNNWQRTAAGAYAATGYANYPVYGSTAIFASDVQTTVTIPATEGTTTVSGGVPSWTVSTLNLTGMDAPLVFTAPPQGQTCYFYIASSITATKASNRLVFDGCLCQLAPGLKGCGASAYDAENGGNLVVTFTGGATAQFNNIEPSYPGVKIRIEDGSLVKAGNISSGSGNLSYPTVIEIEDAELRSTGRIEPDSNAKGSTIVRFLGRNPKFVNPKFQGKFSDGNPGVFEFVVPVGGYYAPPLHFYNDEVFGVSGNHAPVLRVAADSPALAAGIGTTNRLVNAKISAGSTSARVSFDLPTGVTMSTYTDANGNADGYVVEIPAGAGPALADVAIAYAGDTYFDVTGSVDPGSAGSADIKIYVAEGDGAFAAVATTNVTAAGAFRLRVANRAAGTSYRWYAEAVSASGSHATEPEAVTFRSGIASVSAATVEPYPVANGDTVYKFTDSTTPGSITFAQGGLVEVLVVGGGGGGGNSVGGGGGGGAFLHRRAFVPAGTYAVAVGKGGYNETAANGVLPVAAESSSIGALFVAAGGGAGGCLDISSGTSIGGSAGGNNYKTGGTPTTAGTYPFGHDGGVSAVGNNSMMMAGGGGGAGGVGGDGRIWNTTYTSGYGGDGVACDITGESVVYAAGGGGGAAGTGSVPGAAGLGGVPGCGPMAAIRVQDAPANTGAGGGGGNYGSNYLKQGGAGGSGIVVVRVLTGADDGSGALDVRTLVAEAAGNSATVTGSLLHLGAGADSANVWLIVTGGGETRTIDLGATNAVPTVFSYTVEGLSYGTEYTFYLTATNNLGAGAGDASGAVSAATPGNELYYSEITFPYAPATPLENFPVLVRISSASPEGFSYANCPTADTLWFLDDTGAVLPFEVDTWNPQGESLVWVSVPNFSASTTLTMQWAVDAHSRPVVPAATEVWSRAGYAAVWHMNEILVDGEDKHYTPDATANGWNAYKANEADAFPLADSTSSYAASTPPTGRAVVNQLGDNTYTTGGFLVPAALTSGTTIGPFSISLFEAFLPVENNKYARIVSFASDVYALGNMTVSLGNCWIYNGSVAPTFGLSDGQANNAWRHVAGVWDAVPYGYLNGAVRNLNQKNWVVSKTIENDIGLGTLIGHTETLQGYMDEVRIRNAASSSDWMAAEYATVMDAAYAVFEEAAIDTGAPRIGTPNLVEASGTGATIAATVVKLGDNATQADIWLVLEGGGETRTYPVGTAMAPLQSFTNTVSGLDYSTVYTAHFTVTNNASPAVGADSRTVSFETETLPAAMNTASFSISGSGKTLTASVEVTDLGTGTTTLYLMTGPGWNSENTVAASRVLSGTGVQTFTVDYPDVPWGTSVYASFLLVNGTDANAITNGPYTANGQAFYNKYVTFQDNSTYTWIGGAAGDWNDPTQWELTSKGSAAGETPAGYPVYGSAAIFATNIEVTVTIPATAGTSVAGGTACWAVNSLNLNGMSAPITFVSTSAANECRIQANGIYTDNALLDLTFDGCFIYTDSTPTIGANAAVNGRNAVMTFTNGAYAHFKQIYITKPAAKVRVLDGAYLEDTYLACGTSTTGEENRPVLEVRDAEYMNRGGKVEFDWNNNSYGLLIRVSGTHPRVSSVNFGLNRASGGCIEFVVPAGGYADAPVHLLSNNAFNSAKAAPIALRIATNSPARFAGFATTTRLVDAKLVNAAEEAAAVLFDAPAGVTMSHHTNEDGHEEGYDCTIPAGNGPVLSHVGIVACDDTSVRIGGTVDKAASIKVYVAVAGGEFVQAGSSGSSGGSFLIKARNLTPGMRYRWYVEAATASGSHRTEAQEFTFRPGKASVAGASVEPIWAGDEKVYVFTNSTEAGSITFAQGGLVEVLVVGGGGAGGNAMGGGGGAGAFLHRRDFIPAGTYEVTVGKGGYNTTTDQGTYAVPAEASSIGDVFVAPGGGAGGHWNSQGLTQGGSAGGNSSNANIPAIGTYPFGRDGGSQTTGGQWIGAGGGGAGGAGHDARTWGDVYYGGRGGDGVACDITGASVVYAAGGGGGAGTAGFIPGTAGLGGVRGCGMSDTEIFDAPDNTGSGGGGGNYQNNVYRKGGSGGSGIVVIRVKRIRAQPTVFIVQ